MKRMYIYFLAGIALVISACSANSFKRTGYEMMQNVQEQQCQQELSSICPGGESYEEYQKNIKEAEAR